MARFKLVATVALLAVQMLDPQGLGELAGAAVHAVTHFEHMVAHAAHRIRVAVR